MSAFETKWQPSYDLRNLDVNLQGYKVPQLLVVRVIEFFNKNVWEYHNVVP